MEEMQDSTSWLDSDDDDSGGDDDEEEVGEDSDDDGPKDANNDDNDPFDEDEANLENPLQAPSAEDEPIASSSAPVSEKRLYVEVKYHVLKPSSVRRTDYIRPKQSSPESSGNRLAATGAEAWLRNGECSALHQVSGPAVMFSSSYSYV